MQRCLWNTGHHEPRYFIPWTSSTSDWFHLGFYFQFLAIDTLGGTKGPLLRVALASTCWRIILQNPLTATPVRVPPTSSFTSPWPRKVVKALPHQASTCSPQASMKLPWIPWGSAYWRGLQKRGWLGVPSRRFLFWHLPEGKLLKCFRAPSGK